MKHTLVECGDHKCAHTLELMVVKYYYQLSHVGFVSSVIISSEMELQ
jgi:hypothetical protein